jgi:HSP20 family protein
MNDPKESAARLLRFRQALERLIEDVLPGPADSISGPSVPIDVVVRPDSLEVLVEVPGFRAENLEVSASGGCLLVEGYRPAAPGLPGSVLCLERPVGRFRRVIDVPVAADTRRAVGVLRDGVLTISVPRIRDRRGQACAVPIFPDDEASSR